MALRKLGQKDLARIAGQAVYVVVVAGFTFAWAQAVPFMIRPMWSFSGQVPLVPAVQPIQANITWLACWPAGRGGTVRATIVALSKPPRPTAVKFEQVKPGRLAQIMPILMIPVQAMFITLLLGGLVDNLALGAVMFVLITLILGRGCFSSR